MAHLCFLLLLAAVQSAVGQFMAIFKVTYDDTLHLPPGTRGSDLMADVVFKDFVRKLISGAMVIPSTHVQPGNIVVTDAQVMEDVNSEAVNSHGGVQHGKKKVRFSADMIIMSRVIAEEIARMPELTLAGLAAWRKLKIEAPNLGSPGDDQFLR
eukprot:TRINITY_DN50454_c0_g1_i1.p1 TRINITY_DN50454_c0_g1~~TRINITY_DN50454_c0_g1_i1.p1  ORF type:complete len:154 (+),score=37.51 TRINITY_DN50454_c0_g1_i1:29-490(+)